MAHFLFQGASALTLDGKGRLAVPSRHREPLAAICGNQLTITRHPQGPLMIFPRPAWEEFRERIATLPMSAIGWKRVFLGNAMDVEIDNSSRILISPELRRSAGLEKDVMLLGMGNHLELWDATKYAVHESETLDSELPEALKDFSF